MTTPLKIAFLGTRGIPANYGGFETFAEECATRLVNRGHLVTVYCRSHYVPAALSSYRGVRLVVLPTLRWKYTDTIVHMLLSALHTLSQNYDMVLVCNAANSAFAWIPRLSGAAVAVNVDGIERHRQKWNWMGKLYYRISERLSFWLANAIVTDARCIQAYYREQYNVESVFIPYGAITERPSTQGILEELGLRPAGYFLYVSRFEPENNADLVVGAFEKIRTEKRLVMVGDAPYSERYVRKVKATRDSRILFPGAIYGTGYRELQANAYCYIHATEVGGTHPALIEAMGQGNIVIVNATPENIEVTGDTGIPFRKNDLQHLAQRLQEVADCSEKFSPLKQAALLRSRDRYSWDAVVDEYEKLFFRLAGSHQGLPGAA